MAELTDAVEALVVVLALGQCGITLAVFSLVLKR